MYIFFLIFVAMSIYLMVVNVEVRSHYRMKKKHVRLRPNSECIKRDLRSLPNASIYFGSIGDLKSAKSERFRKNGKS